MPHIDQMRESKFLKKEDVGAGALLTITGVNQQNVAKEGAPPELKWCVTFHEIDKPMVCNSTNAQIIAQVTGSPETDNWIGHKIVLYTDPNIQFQGKLVGGIRCRAPRNQPKLAPAPASMQPAQNPNWQRPPQPAPAPAPAPAPCPVQTGPPGGACDEQGVPVDGDDIPF
jgi:hypothetical protein